MIQMTATGKRAKAFTIVELLVVIVVIAILASIAVVSYSGVQQRARVSAASSDLRNIWQGIVLEETDRGAAPANIYGEEGRMMLANALKSAGLYSTTRRPSAAEPSHAKSFVFCYHETTAKISIVAVKPMLPDDSRPTPGTKFTYIDDVGLKEGEVTNTPGTLIGEAFCQAVDEGHTGYLWSWNAPAPFAP